MSKMKRRLLKSLAGLMAFIVVVATGGYFTLKSSLPDYDRQLTLSKLEKNIDIIRDRYAVPHIFAESIGDAYFGLGFAHAQDRLWQLEVTRAAGRGQLSEIFGASTLSVDKLTRTVNSAQVAALTLQRLSDDTKQLYQRYIDGINSYIEHRTGTLPPEFLLFSAQPRLWTLQDTAAVFALIALGTDNWQQELRRAAMQQRLSSAQIAALFPEYPREGLVTHASLDKEKRSGSAAEPKALPLGQLPYLPALSALIQHPLIEAYPASNTWVVHGKLTRSGKPILASDPHGPIKAPADYYLAHLSGADFDITGVGYVGMPVFAIGHNRHIAWGLTDIMADMSDLYAEKIVEGRPGYYQTAEGEKPFSTRSEVIKVKGERDVVIEVRSTQHGPVISDVVVDAEVVGRQSTENIVLALSEATFSLGNISVQAFMGINRATNWQEFKVAMRDYEMAQNLSYADTQGNIGLVSSARVPLRKSGDGFMITPGWDKAYGILGYLNSVDMPYSLNPDQGFIVNANNKAESWDYPYFLSREHVAPYRMNRISEQIIGARKHTVDSMMDIQTDVISSAAKQLLPTLLRTKTVSGAAAKAIKRLSEWDASMDANIAEPLIYMAWERELSKLLYQDELGENFEDYFSSRPDVLAKLLTPNSGWCDNKQTAKLERCDELLTQALHSSLLRLSRVYGKDVNTWRWGDAHQALFRNDIFTHVPFLSRFSDIALANDGGPHTVNQARSDYNSTRPFDQNYGPRYRQIIDLGNLSNSRFMIAPGVSGNFLSPYYSHLAELWRDKQYIQLATDKSVLLEQAIGTTKLLKGRE